MATFLAKIISFICKFGSILPEIITNGFCPHNLGIKIDKYVCVHDEGVIEVIDALGGIPIYVEKRMHYNDYSAHLYINLEKGNTVLNGKQAVGYLRYRKDGF